MKFLSVAILLMMSFTMPVNHQVVRTPAAEVRNSSVEELLKKALESRERGDFEGALALLKEAQAIDPAHPDVGFYTGLTLYNLGKFEDAEAQLREVLKNSPLYVEAKIILGQVLVATGKLPESERLLREAIAQSPDTMQAYDALSSNLLAQKKTDEAIFILDLGLARKPEEATLLMKKAKIYFVSKNLKKAEEVARILTGITDLKGRYQGHVLLAKIAFEQNPMIIAAPVDELREAIDLDPANEEAHLVLADVYTSLWKFGNARTVLEEALDVVRDRSVIERKISEIQDIEKDVLNFSVTGGITETNFKDSPLKWKDFYLEAAWRIDPYKSLVFGFEKFNRGGLHDESIRIEYVEKVNKWVYLMVSAKVTVDPDFREKNALKMGGNFVSNPLGFGTTKIVAEAEARHYENDKLYFLTGGIDQNIGDSFLISARVFRVLTDTGKSDFFTIKTTWSLTPKLDLSANYGTMTEDMSGRPLRGTSKGIGAEYRVSDRVSLTGNYQRVRNDTYRANQVTAGVKIKFGPQKSAPAPVKSFREPVKRKKFLFF